MNTSPITQTMHVPEGLFDESEVVILLEVGPEVCALTVQHVKEVLTVAPITTVPGSPKYVLGIMALHGKVLPVLSFRHILGLETDGQSTGSETRIVVLDLQDRQLGILVDRAGNLLRIRDEGLAPLPVGHALDRFATRGICQDDGRWIAKIEASSFASMKGRL